MRRNLLRRYLKIWVLSVCVTGIGAGAYSPAAHAALEVETVHVSRGVRVWYASNPRVPVVDIVISFEGAGAASDPAGKEGRAAFAASLLNEGAGELTSAQFQRAMEERAITLSADADADRLNVHVHCLREDAPRAGELLAMALSKPRLEEADQARMKAELGSILRQQEESAGYQSTRQLFTRVFAGHPYANPTYGTQASIDALNGDDVRAYLHTYVTRNNVRVAAAGDVDSSLLDQMLGPVIDALPENDAGAVAIQPAVLQGAGKSLSKTMPVPQTVVSFVAPYVAREDKRYYAAYLLNYILGGDALESRLSALRKKGGLVYGASTGLEARRGGSFIIGQLATRNQSVAEAVAQTKAILTDLSQKGITTAECADAKSYVIGSKMRELDASSTISATLLSMQIHQLGEDYLARRSALFEAVDCADISKLAAEYLKPERFTFSSAGGTVEMASPTAPEPVAATGAQ